MGNCFGQGRLNRLLEQLRELQTVEMLPMDVKYDDLKICMEKLERKEAGITSREPYISVCNMLEIIGQSRLQETMI